jgi:hypothetical protein
MELEAEGESSRPVGDGAVDARGRKNPVEIALARTQILLALSPWGSNAI